MIKVGKGLTKIQGDIASITAGKRIWRCYI